MGWSTEIDKLFLSLCSKDATIHGMDRVVNKYLCLHVDNEEPWDSCACGRCSN